jgi:hypothetical protein
MLTILAATAIILVVVALHLRQEKRMGLKLDALNAAVSNLEVNANPGESSADQAVIDQLTTRLQAVGARFAVPATPAPMQATPPAQTADQGQAGDAGSAEANVAANQSTNPDANASPEGQQSA